MSRGFQYRRPEAPKVKPRVKQLLTLKENQRIVGTVVSSHVWGFAVHWNPSIKRTIPCHKMAQLCEGCRLMLPNKQLWVIELWEEATKSSGFVQLTPGAADMLNQLADLEPMRGMIVVVARKNGGKKSRVVVEAVDRVSRPEELPKPSDPLVTMRRIWGQD